MGLRDRGPHWHYSLRFNRVMQDLSRDDPTLHTKIIESIQQIQEYPSLVFWSRISDDRLPEFLGLFLAYPLVTTSCKLQVCAYYRDGIINFEFSDIILANEPPEDD